MRNVTILWNKGMSRNRGVDEIYSSQVTKEVKERSVMKCVYM